MRILNPQNIKGQPLFVGKLITELPDVTEANNGQVYIYVGNENIDDVCVGDILTVQEGKLIVINRNQMSDTSQYGELQVNLYENELYGSSSSSSQA